MLARGALINYSARLRAPRASKGYVLPCATRRAGPFEATSEHRGEREFWGPLQVERPIPELALGALLRQPRACVRGSVTFCVVTEP